MIFFPPRRSQTEARNFRLKRERPADWLHNISAKVDKVAASKEAMKKPNDRVSPNTHLVQGYSPHVDRCPNVH